jgi:hypothetical protein
MLPDGTIVPMRFYQRDARVCSIMIEVRRDQYMDEQTGKKPTGFDEVAAQIQAAVREVATAAPAPRSLRRPNRRTQAASSAALIYPMDLSQPLDAVVGRHVRVRILSFPLGDDLDEVGQRLTDSLALAQAREPNSSATRWASTRQALRTVDRRCGSRRSLCSVLPSPRSARTKASNAAAACSGDDPAAQTVSLHSSRRSASSKTWAETSWS